MLVILSAAKQLQKQVRPQRLYYFVESEMKSSFDRSFFQQLINYSYFHLFFQDCSFVKQYSATTLKVEYNGDFRIAFCLNCCKRWYFTFNGMECKGPLAIDGLHHIHVHHGKTDYNVHKVTHIAGYCQGIPRGTVRVGINVGDCVGRKSGSDAYTEWNSVTRIMIEEVPPPQKQLKDYTKSKQRKRLRKIRCFRLITRLVTILNSLCCNKVKKITASVGIKMLCLFFNCTLRLAKSGFFSLLNGSNNFQDSKINYFV